MSSFFGLYPDPSPKYHVPPPFNPNFMPEASAPPMSPLPSYANASAPPMSPEQPSAPTWDDCSICLENCGDHPEGDTSKPRVIAQTECHHYFHDFCLQKHLAAGINENCPNCRHPIDQNRVSHINLGGATSSSEETASKAGNLARGLFSVLGKVSWFVASNTLNIGWQATKAVGSAVLSTAAEFAWPTTIDPASVQLINREVDRVHDQIRDKLREQQEAMRTLLAQVSSIGQNPLRNPVEVLEQIRVLQARVESQANRYLRETNDLIARMRTVSAGL